MNWLINLLQTRRLRKEQEAFTRVHRAQEHADGFRLMHLGDGHLMGYRPWCSTELFPCTSEPGRKCCRCSHSDREY